MVHEGGREPIDEVLDQQAWLMRLARRLGRDETAAEELCQESLIAAWTHPPRERGGALRAWLRSVVAHRARTGATAERRRREREERSARPEAVAAADEIAERLELARRVAAALDELPEAERRALYLRYYEELSPPDIARAVGAPLGTIKSRLALGREHLRRKLDRDYGERGTWLGLLVPLSSPVAVTPLAPHSTLAPASTPGSLLIGALTMATKTTVALGVTAVLGLALLLWKPWDVPSSASAAAPVVVERSGAVDPGDVRARGVAAGSDLSSARIPVGAAPRRESELTTGQVEIAATYAVDGTPAAHLHGSLAPAHLAWREDGGPPVRQFELDEQGRVALSHLEPGTWVARLNGRTVAGEAVDVIAARSARADLIVQPGLSVRGLVLDENEAPVSGAEIFSSHSGDVPGRGRLTTTDGAGRFTLRDLAPWRPTSPYTSVAARASGRTTSSEWEAVGSVGDSADIVLRLFGPAGGLSGRVLDASGAPVAGATIEFPGGGWTRHHGLSPEGLQLDEQPRLHLESASDGTFASDRLPVGTLGVAVSTDAHPTKSASVDIEAGRTAELEIVLATGGVLEGTVVDPLGKPAFGATVKACLPESSDALRSATTDSEGHYLLSGLPAGTVQALAKMKFGRESKAELTIAAGETTAWDVRLSVSERASGTLLDESGAPLEGWSIHVIEPSRTGTWYVTAHTDAAGRFALENCPEGAKAIEVCVPETFAAPPILVVPFPPGGQELVLVVPDESRPSATLAGRFVDPSGVPIHGLEMWLSAEGGLNWSKQILPDRATQAFEFGPLVAGAYRLLVQTPGYIEQWIEVPAVAVGEFRDLGAIELRRGALLEIELDGQAGAELGEVVAELSTQGQTLSTWWIDGRTWRSEQLAPGRYSLRIGGSRIAFHEEQIELVPGETAHVSVPIQPGTARYLKLDGGQVNEEASVALFDAGGKPFRGPVSSFEDRVNIYGLTAGRWTARYSSLGGKDVDLEFTVDTLEPQSEPLTLVVR